VRNAESATLNSRNRNAKRRSRRTSGNAAVGNARQPLIPALVATGACSLAASPAAALQLGELEVQSALGQPLRASIAYALRPDEQLFSDCVVIKPAFGLPALDRATITECNASRNTPQLDRHAS